MQKQNRVLGGIPKAQLQQYKKQKKLGFQNQLRFLKQLDNKIRRFQN